MYKYLLIVLLPLTLLAQSDMKCEAGKCSGGKEIPQKENTQKHVETKEQPIIKREHQKPTIEQLFNVKTVQVKEITVAKEQVNYGYIVAQDSLKVDVTAWYSGFVKELYADTRYKQVTKGEPLVKVYSPEVYKAKQDYLNSINYNKRTPMPEMLESSRTKLRLLGVDEKEIEEIKRKEKADEFTTIYAPMNGWIFKKEINQGSSFNANKRLFQIVNLKSVWMEVKLFQNELKMLDKLDNFTVKIKGIEKVYEAKKSLLYPMLNPKEATATLRLEIDNKNGVLQPGMYAKVHASATSKSRIVIPRTAAIRKSGRWYAFLATEFKGEYEPIQIELKPLDNQYYEVIKGLHTGDNIVNNALFMMDSDAQINSIY